MCLYIPVNPSSSATAVERRRSPPLPPEENEIKKMLFNRSPSGISIKLFSACIQCDLFSILLHNSARCPRELSTTQRGGGCVARGEGERGKVPICLVGVKIGQPRTERVKGPKKPDKNVCERYRQTRVFRKSRLVFFPSSPPLPLGHRGDGVPDLYRQRGSERLSPAGE